MRIIAGKYRSRRLTAPAGTGTRPTSDRLRETLFNVVANLVPESIWLDLFAGTGAVGIEALSRGARKVYFVESSKRAGKVIRQNLQLLGIGEEEFELMEEDAIAALRALDSRKIVCDVCFLDPPYRNPENYQQTLTYLAQSGILRPESLVIAEHDKRFDPGEVFAALSRFRILRQGDAILSLYRRS